MKHKFISRAKLDYAHRSNVADNVPITTLAKQLHVNPVDLRAALKKYRQTYHLPEAMNVHEMIAKTSHLKTPSKFPFWIPRKKTPITPIQ